MAAAAAWRVLDPHPWFNWSVLGSALIIFVLYFMVEVSVTINDWYGSYFDMIQKALDLFADLARQAIRSEQRVRRGEDGAAKEAKNGFQVPGLGKLVLRNRAARMGRNPQTGEPIKIPASAGPTRMSAVRVSFALRTWAAIVARVPRRNFSSGQETR